MKSTFACVDSNARENAAATSKWTQQHAHSGWMAYTEPTYKFRGQGDDQKPRCQADEFPPGYFMPPDAKEKNLGQIIRWLPGSINRGATNTEWRQFCTNHDGGAGNGQFHKDDKKEPKRGQ